MLHLLQCKKRLFITVLGIVAIIIINLIIIATNGSPVPAPNIPRTTQIMGTGPAIKYVVMGDSTSIGQGATYEQSYAYKSAQHLAEKRQVLFTNLGVSGARMQDVESNQLPEALQLQPDLVLIAVGANDVTHLTSKATIENSLQVTITTLKNAHPSVRIVITGSPAMGSVDRFPMPAKQITGLRAKGLNNTVFKALAKKNNITFAPIAEKTGSAFAADPTLFAQDKFHPNARGYELWTPIITSALDAVLQ